MLSTNRITSVKLSIKYHGSTLTYIQSQNCILSISNRIYAQNSYRVIPNPLRVCIVGARSKAVQATCALRQPSGTQAPMSPETSLLQPHHADMREGVIFYSKIDFLTIFSFNNRDFVFNILMSSRALWSLFAYIFYPYLPTISFYKTYFL